MFEICRKKNKGREMDYCHNNIYQLYWLGICSVASKRKSNSQWLQHRGSFVASGNKKPSEDAGVQLLKADFDIPPSCCFPKHGTWLFLSYGPSGCCISWHHVYITVKKNQKDAWSSLFLFFKIGNVIAEALFSRIPLKPH